MSITSSFKKRSNAKRTYAFAEENQWERNYGKFMAKEKFNPTPKGK
jgi:hypothetical protein